MNVKGVKQAAFNMNRIFSSILLLFSTKTHSLDSLHASVQFVPVGGTVRIPCEGYGDRTSGRWLYRRDNMNFQTIVQKSKGIILKQTALWPRKRILEGFCLEISPFTEQDGGIYACQACVNTEMCSERREISLFPVPPQHETLHFIIKGGRFHRSCQHNLNLKDGWTFKPHEGNNESQLNSKLTDKSLLFITDVQPSHAGKYSCWIESPTGQRYTVYSVTVCVLTVADKQMNDSPWNCTLYCDVEKDAERHPAVVVTENWNISITGTLKKPKSSVLCSFQNSSVDKYSLENEATTQSDATANVTVDGSSSQAATLISACAAAFLVIVALVIILWILRQRVNADRRSVCPSATRTIEDEAETSVIYSVLEVSRYRQQSIITPADECVYSQIEM